MAMRGSLLTAKLASQDARLHAAGYAKVYSEKISGAPSDRAELAKLLKRLGSGDGLMVTRLDRLARSTLDLLKILDTITKLRKKPPVPSDCSAALCRCALASASCSTTTRTDTRG